MQLTPYLTFNGQCEAAFRFYEQLLGGKIVDLFTFAGTEAAEYVPPDWRNKILHVRLQVGDHELMGSDSPSPDRYEAPRGVYVSLNVEDLADAERIFHALAEGGTVEMPIQETFWAHRFGMVTDRFGTPWMINCEKAT